MEDNELLPHDGILGNLERQCHGQHALPGKDVCNLALNGRKVCCRKHTARGPTYIKTQIQVPDVCASLSLSLPIKRMYANVYIKRPVAGDVDGQPLTKSESSVLCEWRVAPSRSFGQFSNTLKDKDSKGKRNLVATPHLHHSTTESAWNSQWKTWQGPTGTPRPREVGGCPQSVDRAGSRTLVSWFQVQGSWFCDLPDIGEGVALREVVGMPLPEDVAHSAARHDLQAPTTHPHPEGELCRR